MILLLVFASGLVTGLATAGGFWILGYKLARAHEDQIREFNDLSSRIET